MSNTIWDFSPQGLQLYIQIQHLLAPFTTENMNILPSSQELSSPTPSTQLLTGKEKKNGDNEVKQESSLKKS